MSTEKPTATFVKDLTGFTGTTKLYKISKPRKVRNKKFTYVAVSKAFAPFSGPETYIFPASSKGEVVDWGELDGSQKGEHTHKAVLEVAGYTVAEMAKS